MARISVLLVLTAITLACVDAWVANVDDGLGPPISPAEFAAALASPFLRNPPPDRADAIEHSGLFQGDIALTTEQQAEIAKGRSATRGSIWENGVIPYTISNVFTSAERQVIAAAMAEYAAKTCLSFVGRTTQTDYINIISSTGCWSFVGRVGGRQDVSLRQNSCVYFGITIHEFMHAAGFQHEQSRYDRDNYVIINWQNIMSGTSYNFEKQSTSTTTDLGLPYDYTSVMHYSAYAFSANGQATITSRQAGQTLGQRNGFSELDVKGLNLLYECDGTVTGGCTNTHDSCQDWADAGECEKNPDYMTTECQKACGSCECVDNEASCPDWAEAGECEKNPDYMLTECPKSCDSCDGVKPTAGTTEEPAVTTKPPNKCKAKNKCTKKGGTCQPKKSTCGGKKKKKWCSKSAGCVCCIADTKCEDKNENCSFWKDEGYCEDDEYKQYMKENCPKSCDKC